MEKKNFAPENGRGALALPSPLPLRPCKNVLHKLVGDFFLIFTNSAKHSQWDQETLL